MKPEQPPHWTRWPSVDIDVTQNDIDSGHRSSIGNPIALAVGRTKVRNYRSYKVSIFPHEGVWIDIIRRSKHHNRSITECIRALRTPKRVTRWLKRWWDGKPVKPFKLRMTYWGPIGYENHQWFNGKFVPNRSQD